MGQIVQSPNFRTISEFGNFHGDCGECATLIALHTRDSNRWPLTLSVLNTLTSDEIAKGYADASLSGGQTIYSIANYLRNVVKVPCSVWGWTPSANHNGQAFSVDGLHACLQAQLLTAPDGSLYWNRPIVVQVQEAGLGLPEDEHGVHIHFFTLAGAVLPDGGWLRADGDAVTYNDPSGGQKQPITTPWSEVTAAQPIAYLTIDIDTPVPGGGTPPVGIPTGWKDDGTTLTAPNAGVLLHGFRDYVLQATNFNPDNVPMDKGEFARNLVELGNPALGNGSIIRLRDYQLSYTAARGVFQTQTGRELKATDDARLVALSDASASKAQLGQAQAALAISTANAAAANAALAVAQANLAADEGKLLAQASEMANMQAQIAALQAQLLNPPAPPTPPTPPALADLLKLLDDLGVAHS